MRPSGLSQYHRENFEALRKKSQLEHLVRRFGQIAVAGGALIVAAAASPAALMRLFDPNCSGLWVSPQVTLLGVIDNPNAAQEVLGSRIYPIALLVASLGFMVAGQARALAQDHWRHARRD